MLPELKIEQRNVKKETISLVLSMEKNTKRSSVQIMAEILDSCRQPKTKTQIIHRASLTWSVSNYYLSVLESCGLLNVHHSIARYETTQKGLHFVEKWKELAGLLSEG